MKKMILAPHALAILTLALAAAAPPARAGAPADAAAAEEAYYLGLYLQRARGDLDGARRALDKVLALNPEPNSGALREEALRRKAEIERWQGKSRQASVTLAAAKPASAVEALGPARFFPPQMELVAQVRLADLLASPLVKQLEVTKQIPTQELEKVTTALGINPLKDIQRLTLAATLPEKSEFSLTLSDEDEQREPARAHGHAAKASASTHIQLARQHFLVVAEGRLAGFKADEVLKLMRSVESPGGTPVESARIQGVPVSVLTLEDEGQKIRLGLCRLDDGALVLGDLQSLEEMLAARAGQKPGLRDNPVLQSLIDGVKPDTMVWVAAPAQKILDSAREIRDLLKIGDRPLALRGLLVTSHLGSDLALRATVSTEDAQSAQVLSDIAKGVVALAQFAPVEKPQEKMILKSLKAESREREVTVAVTVPGELIREHAAEGEAGVAVVRTERIVLRVGGDEPALAHPELPTGSIAKVVVADPKVADVTVQADGGLKLRGVGPGDTQLRVIRKDGTPVAFQIRVVKEKGEKAAGESRSVVVDVGKSARLAFKTLGAGEIVRVTVEDPEVADVLMDAADAISVTGLAPGETTVHLLRKAGGETTIRVTVRK
ncbi:MAG: hypothetical protein GYA21_03830 [Myxococcales bacterium]|nr:hypothetical protein [Myxococcales bacterium]